MRSSRRYARSEHRPGRGAGAEMPNLWRGESDEEIATALATHYPALQFVREGGRRIVKGTFDIERDGHFLAGFQIEVLLDQTDVIGLPTVKETGGRIPRVAERHVNVQDGSACLYLPEELVARGRGPMGIADFLSGPVKSFLLGQLCVEQGMPFPYGEWGHGAVGLEQMLAELFGSDDAVACLAYLDVLCHKAIKGHWPCPCRSGRRIRDCHRARIFALRDRIPLKSWRFLAMRATSTPRTRS